MTTARGLLKPNLMGRNSSGGTRVGRGECKPFTAPRPTIHLYPPDGESMPYVRAHMRIWSQLGYNVVPAMSSNTVPRSARVAVLNWYEDWMLANDRPKFISLSWALFNLLRLRLRCARLVWVRHNITPHDPRAAGRTRTILMRVLSGLADAKVAHRDAFDDGTVFVPHPLLTEPPVRPCSRRDIPFLWFGAVKPYKGLARLLGEWPADQPLRICGACKDTALERSLRQIIQRRQLSVQWENRTLSDTELDALLDRTVYLVIAHDDQTMIVSGTFYLAAGRGANILARDSGFARHLTERHRFVTIYRDGRLRATLLTLAPQAPDSICREAVDCYGDAVQSKAWARVLQPST